MVVLVLQVVLLLLRLLLLSVVVILLLPLVSLMSLIGGQRNIHYTAGASGGEHTSGHRP
jgi:hypothetical protein